jgi:hypothetical protein
MQIKLTPKHSFLLRNCRLRKWLCTEIEFDGEVGLSSVGGLQLDVTGGQRFVEAQLICSRPRYARRVHSAKIGKFGYKETGESYLRQRAGYAIVRHMNRKIIKSTPFGSVGSSGLD